MDGWNGIMEMNIDEHDEGPCRNWKAGVSGIARDFGFEHYTTKVVVFPLSLLKYFFSPRSPYHFYISRVYGDEL
jgi:hypothetical protein